MDIMKMGKNPNYLGSWDLADAPNNELTLTIQKIVDEKVVTDKQQEICTTCHFVEDYKPMILNVTNKKTLCKLYKTKDSDKFVGKRVTITTKKVKAFGDVFDALRIKPVLPPAAAETYVKCEICGSPITPRSGMTSKELAAYTKQKYGQALCAACATAKAKEPAKEIANVEA